MSERAKLYRKMLKWLCKQATNQSYNWYSQIVPRVFDAFDKQDWVTVNNITKEEK